MPFSLDALKGALILLAENYVSLLIPLPFWAFVQCSRGGKGADALSDLLCDDALPFAVALLVSVAIFKFIRAGGIKNRDSAPVAWGLAISLLLLLFLCLDGAACYREYGMNGEQVEFGSFLWGINKLLLMFGPLLSFILDLFRLSSSRKIEERAESSRVVS